MKKAEIVEVIPSKKVVVGEKDAPITLVMFGDYESPACAKAHKVIKELLEIYPHDLKFIFRHFPLLKIHQRAHKAAEASLAAAQEGKFWEMHNELFANRTSLGIISLKEHARAVGVKSKKFLDELINSYYGVYVQDDLRDGISLGVRDIPALFINGKRIVEEPTMKNLTTLIKALAAEAPEVKGEKRAA